MHVVRPIYWLLCLALFNGCQNFGVLVKRESELNCPTDIRKTVPWCVGEDAVFRCPCGPNQEFHGHKPTCWGIWPASGAAWRDAHCGPLFTDYCDPITVPEPQPVPPFEEAPLGDPASEIVEPLPEKDDAPPQLLSPDFGSVPGQTKPPTEKLAQVPSVDGTSVDRAHAGNVHPPHEELSRQPGPVRQSSSEPTRSSPWSLRNRFDIQFER